MENLPLTQKTQIFQQDLFSSSFTTGSTETELIQTPDSFLQKLQEKDSETLNRPQVTGELLYWIKASLKNPSNTAKELLEIFQASIKQDFFPKEKFTEIANLLVEACNEIQTKEFSGNMVKVFFGLYETLIECTEKIEFFKNKDKFEADFYKVTVDLCVCVLNLNLEEIYSPFLSIVFNTLVNTQYLNFKKMILCKNCVVSIVKVLRKYLKNSKFKFEVTLEILYFFVLNYEGNLENLQIPQFFILFNKNQLEDFASNVLEILIKRAKEAKDLENSEKLKKVILSLLIEKSVSVKLSQKYFEKILEFEWEKQKLTTEFMAEIKVMFLTSREIERKKFVLDLIFPWISEGFILSELKLIIKACASVPELTQKFLKCILEALKKSLSSPSHFLINKDSSILFTLDLNLLPSREFAIWIKFYPDSLSKLENFLIMQANRSISLLFFIEKRQLKIEIVKNNREKYILFSVSMEFLEKSWNIIGLSFNLRQKNNGKSRFVLTVNENTQEADLDEIGNFRSINSIEILGNGKLEFFNIYSTLISPAHFSKKPNNETPNTNIKSFEILKFHAVNQHPECAIPLNFTSKAEHFYQIPLFNLFKSIGSINLLTPVLKNSSESSTIELFFKILTEMCEITEFHSILDDFTFPVLKFILNEKASLITLEWLDVIEGFLIAFSKFPLYPSAINNLYLNPVLWSTLPEDYFIYYFEAVKTHLLSQYYKLTESSLPTISTYFNSLSSSLDLKFRPCVFFYYFQVLTSLFSKISKEYQVSLLTQVISNILEDPNFCEISEELVKFVNALIVQNWVCLQSESLLGLVECFLKYNEKVNAIVRCRFIALFFNLCKEYCLGIGDKVNHEFIRKTVQSIWLMIGSDLPVPICQVIVDFISEKKVAKTVLSEAINIITEKLIASNDQQALEILNILSIKPTSTIPMLRQRAFPGWIIILLKKNTNNILINLIIQCFTQAKKFNKLKIIIFDLIKAEQFPIIFHILQSIFEKVFFLKQLQEELRVQLMEFFNLVEDTVQRIQFEKMPKAAFIHFIKTCVLPLSKIQFSTCFPNLAGISSFAFFDRAKKEDSENFVVLREGGLGRQLVYFVLYGMSFSPDPVLEDFLKVYLEEKLNSDSRFEWSGLEKFGNVKVSQLVPKSKQKTVKDLIYLFIFIEWAEIIRTYMLRGCDNQEIFVSINNLAGFIKTNYLWKRIEREAKVWLDKPGYKEFNRVLMENLQNLTFDFLPEFIKKFEIMDRFIYKTENIDEKLKLEETERHETFKLSVKNYSKHLMNSIKVNKFSTFLTSTQEYIQIEAFLKVLTTLKIKKISSHYMSSGPSYTYTPYFPSSDPCNSPTLKEYKKPQFFSNSSEFNFQSKIKRILRDHEQFCGKFNLFENGKVHLKAAFDRQGRRSLTKKKEFILDVRENKGNIYESLMSSVDISGALNEKYEESIVSEDQETNTNTEDPEEVFLSSSENHLAEFDCEIIYIKGSLYGIMNIYEDCIVFTSKLTDKPEMSPVIYIDERPILCSSALKETQLKKKVKKIWPVFQISELIHKKFIHNSSSIEFYLKSGKSYLINFFTTIKLREVYSTLKTKFANKGIIFLNKVPISYYQDQWKSGKITNFEYLMILNKYSSRSFHNLAQYPVFPWVLQDYTSDKLNLKSEKSFRNFMFPISAQTADSRERSKSVFSLSKLGFDRPYHFGTHYSAGGIILHYLLRIEPYTSEALNLHRGSFDLPDRIFGSIKKSWLSTQSSSSDTKELIPEFYYLPEMFVNINNENLGFRQCGKVVIDVKLPKWAKNNVFLFLFKHRQALESEYVSKNLHFWIDLIFGFRQLGKKAEEVCNVFHPITYSDIYEKTVTEVKGNFLHGYFCQAVHYGQVPIHLFPKPHPKRENFQVKKTLCEKLIKNKDYVCPLKFSYRSKVIPLSCSNYFIFVLIEEKIFILKFKWTLSIIDKSSEKKIELAGVLPTPRLMAGMYDEKFIVTSGYSDFSIVLHDFFGIIIQILYFHSMHTSDLYCRKWVISASFDSTLVFWTESEKKLLQGHISPVYSVTGIYDLSLIVSCSDYILIHDSRTGEVIQKISEKCSKVLSNSFGFFICQVENELKVFYMNGQRLKSIFHNKQKFFSVISEFLILEDRETINILSIFEENTIKMIKLQDPLDISQFHYTPEKDTLIFINRVNSQYNVNSIEISLREKAQILF